MASIFDFTLTRFVKKMLPPDKRMPKMLAWLGALTAPLQWVRDLWFGDYRQGAASGPSAAQPWLSTQTYAAGDRATYKQKMYESLIAGNINNLPTDQTAWVVRLQNFIGTDERLQYNGMALTLTYALNKYFSTVFRQPPAVSDIYLTTHAKTPSPFIIGATEAESSDVFYNGSSEFIMDVYDFAEFFNLTINVPVAVFNALDPDPDNATAIIRNFADTYIYGGIVYKIATY